MMSKSWKSIWWLSLKINGPLGLLEMKKCEEIKRKLARNKNLMVSKKKCPYCDGARDILKEKNIDFLEVDHTENETLSREIAEKYGHTTYPKIFLNNKFIGGMSELEEYVKTKEFKDTFETE